MNKTAKGLVALSAVLVLLGGGYAALQLTEPKEEEESSSSETAGEQQSVVLIRDIVPDGPDDPNKSYQAGVIKTVDVKNKTDELHVVQKSTKTSDSAATYTLDGYQDVVMKDTMIGTLANNANELTSEAVIEENCTDLAKFGLASPAVTVDIVYESGTEYRMLIGNEAPTGGVTYVMIDGVDTVYTVRDSTIANYSKTVLELVDTTVLAAPEELPIVESLRIEREDIDYDIFLEYDKKSDDSGYTGGTSATHVMVEPTSAYLSVERSTDVTTGMFGLSASGVYCVHCEESDIAEAGLKDPFCTVTMSCNDGNEYVLLLSEPFTDSDNSRQYYAMLEGGNVIFIVGEDKAKWTTVTPVDIASKIFIASYVWNITDLEVSCNTGDKAAFTLKKKPGEVKDSYTSADIITTMNGMEYDSERFRQFYSFLISANAESFALGEDIPSGAPMATLAYTDSYTGEKLSFEFYEKSAMTALIVVNGESKFNITKSYVETLIENVKLLDSDEDFKTTWR